VSVSVRVAVILVSSVGDAGLAAFRETARRIAARSP